MNFQNKYKNRNPSETVAIIKDFFSELHIEVKEDLVIEAISGTWSVGVSAFYNKNPIYIEYSLAKDNTPMVEMAFKSKTSDRPSSVIFADNMITF